MSEEAILIDEYLKGDEQALNTLVRKYTRTVFSFAYTFVRSTEEAEDITQDTFLKVWKNIKKFDPKRDFKVWLLSITKNTALDYLRKRRPVLFSQFENEQGENVLIETLADTEPAALEIFETKENAEKVQAAVETLNVEERLILHMHETEGLTFNEISDVLGQSQNTLKSRYRRALIKLKTILQDSVIPAPKTPEKAYN